jgi:RNA polymerase sigma-70 factor (ECF subfamily)
MVRGDEETFAQIYGQHSKAIYNYVLRSVRDRQISEDVTQEIWLTVHRQLHTLQDQTCFRTWLYRIAQRACVDAARRRSRSAAGQICPDTQATRPESDPGNIVVFVEHSRLTWQALGALSSRQHSALFLKVVEARTYQEIAEILGTSEEAVGDLLFRARRKMAETYDHLKEDAGARCRMAQRAIAALVDNEATPVHMNALRAHVKDCRSCREELAAQTTASQSYAGLAMFPVPAAVTGGIFGGTRMEPLAQASGSVGKLFWAGLIQTKIAAVVVAAATVTGVAVAAPASESDLSSAPAGGENAMAPDSYYPGSHPPMVERGPFGGGTSSAGSAGNFPLPATGVTEIDAKSIVDQGLALIEVNVSGELATVENIVDQAVRQALGECTTLLEHTNSIPVPPVTEGCAVPTVPVPGVPVPVPLPEQLDLPVPTPSLPIAPLPTLPAVPPIVPPIP